MLATKTRSYDEICEEGRMATSDGDAANWTIGDLACEVVTAYSEHTLADFAREIGKPKGTVYEARQMSGFWQPSERAEIVAEYPNVTRSHMRKCLPLRDLDLARFALDKCSTRGWTVDQFGYILKRYRQLKGLAKSTPKTERAEFEGKYNPVEAAIFFPHEVELQIDKLMRAHPDATITVVVTWTEQPGAPARDINQ